MDSSTTSSAPAVHLDSSILPGLVGSATLDLDGTIVTCNQIPEADLRILFQMLSETSGLEEGVRRIGVTATGTRKYTVARDSTHVYVALSE